MLTLLLTAVLAAALTVAAIAAPIAHPTGSSPTAISAPGADPATSSDRDPAAAPVVAGPVVAASRADDPHREFDFWVGEWSVLNRHHVEGRRWRDGDTTRARITPVCGDRAILEEWAGPFRGSFMNGFSLRAWDPDTEAWKLVLFWTTDGRSSFGTLEGRFRHGRGEFFSGSGNAITRYSFSDGLPDSVRWDSAGTGDGGRSWATDWIMEFSRTRPATEVTQAELFSTDWTRGEVSPFEEARALDGLLGTWHGIQEHPDGTELEARMRAKLLAKDCLVLTLLETRERGSTDWHEQLTVRGWVASAERWESWTLDEDDTRLRRATAELGAGSMSFEGPDPDSGFTTYESFLLGEGGHLLIEASIDDPRGGEARVVATTSLAREQG